MHRVPGRHRPDDPRTGWISGLEGEEAERHPTVGGLRIGKELNERGPDEPYDPRLEWDRDGQYFHYLTRWMLALAAAASVLEEPRYQRWALELARAGHDDAVPVARALAAHAELAARIIGFWRRPESRAAPTWKDHLDVNAVMLATALEPDAWISL